MEAIITIIKYLIASFWWHPLTPTTSSYTSISDAIDASLMREYFLTLYWLTQNTIHLLDPKPLPGRNMPVPYCFIADDAFVMTTYILKPYPFHNQPAPNRIFNHRLSRAQKIVENAFGIVANCFRVLRKPMNLNPDRARDVVMAICTLHNFLLSKN